MLAVSENGGRIRPPVTIVKALASAMCIGAGGSVGREGPIVQIGSAFASTLGQLVRMSETRLRIIVACGAAGGIAATFNAPLAGPFFAMELILRDFAAESFGAVVLASVTASVGIFCFGQDGSASEHHAMVGADLAMYAAKHAGRDRYAPLGLWTSAPASPTM